VTTPPAVPETATAAATAETVADPFVNGQPWGEGPDSFPRLDTPEYDALTIDAATYTAFWGWIREWNEMIAQPELTKSGKPKPPRQRRVDALALVRPFTPQQRPLGWNKEVALQELARQEAEQPP
jgi:hypothetical protein